MTNREAWLIIAYNIGGMEVEDVRHEQAHRNTAGLPWV